MQSHAMNLGLSPCPNDTFIFHALLHGLVKLDADIEFMPHMADVEELNKKALKGELEISKISLGVLPYIVKDYVVLSAGAALGWGCGPLLVARRELSEKELAKARIAIPGKMTTANLLLNLHGAFHGPRTEMLFSDIMPAVTDGKADAGLIIHEGRFTYARAGLCKLLDMGEWWEGMFHLPLPLGAIVARRDVAADIAKAVEKGIASSVAHAWRNPDDSREYIKRNAQELDDAVTKAHIETFVTTYSQDLGEAGKMAIRKLVDAALSLEGNSCGMNLFIEDNF